MVEDKTPNKFEMTIIPQLFCERSVLNRNKFGKVGTAYNE